MNPRVQLLEDLRELLDKHKTPFNLCTSPDLTLAKTRAIRRMTREEVDLVLENFFDYNVFVK